MIKKIRVKNFKSLLDTEVELAPVTVLIGRSGTGKSNFVDAISALQGWIARPPPNPNTISNYRPANLADPKSVMEWEISFDVPGTKGEFSYHLTVGFQNLAVVTEGLNHAGTSLFHQDMGKWVVHPKLADIQRPGGVMLGQLTAIPTINLAHITMTQGIRSYDFPSNVLTPASQGGVAGSGLGRSGGNYLAVIDSIVGDIQALRRWSEVEAALKILSSLLEGITVTPFQGDRISVSFQFGGKLISLGLGQQSEGFRRFLAHMLAIYQNPTPQVIMFEEPDKGIFPGALSLLADHIKTASEKLGVQFILTTHSPQLLNAFSEQSIRVATISDQGTRISPLGSEDLAILRDKLMSPGELLTVTEPPAATIAGS